MTSELDLPHLRSWIGKTHTAEDTITPRLAESLAAILDDAPAVAEGKPAPTGIHWCLAPAIAPMSALGPDGHPARGGFLPPVPLARRMWAGGRLAFSGVFLVGETVRRNSTVTGVEVKTGRTGALCFVTVEHRYHGEAGLLLTEEQDIVYRDIAPAVAPPPPERPRAADESDTIEADAVLLARYSAVTFNGHRIHYDRDYTREKEFYPGLLVHGPLQATWLLRKAQMLRDGRLPETFGFRGLSPLYDGQNVTVNAARGDDGALSLWVAAQNGVVTMEATASGTAPAGR